MLYYINNRISIRRRRRRPNHSNSPRTRRGGFFVREFLPRQIYIINTTVVVFRIVQVDRGSNPFKVLYFSLQTERTGHYCSFFLFVLFFFFFEFSKLFMWLESGFFGFKYIFSIYDIFFIHICIYKR